MNDLTQKIRDRAFQLWEDAGRPNGRDDAFWAQAEREIQESSDQDRSSDQPKSENEQLDESLEDSFPSSDPLSEVQPGGGITGPGDAR